MHEKKEGLFVLVVESDRTVAAALAMVLRQAGYRAGVTDCAAAALRIGSRVLIDALVMDAAEEPPATVEAALALQRLRPSCGILLFCNHSQAEEVTALAEKSQLPCEVIARPLSRVELLTKLHAVAGEAFPNKPGRDWQLQTA